MILEKHPHSNWDIPKNKDYPADSAQCDHCGGLGCGICGDRGWVPSDHSHARRCERKGCRKIIPPDQWAIYCSNECGIQDA